MTLNKRKKTSKTTLKENRYIKEILSFQSIFILPEATHSSTVYVDDSLVKMPHFRNFLRML